MRILMVGPGRDMQGGIATVVDQYYDAKLDTYVDLKYISTMHDGIKIRKLYQAISALVQFMLCIKNYEIVHIHMASRNSFHRKKHFIKLAKKHGKKIIIHLHGAEFDTFYDKECNESQRLEVKKIFLMANAVIALSVEWGNYLEKVCDKQKVVVLHNAVKMPLFTRESYDDTNVLFLGRLGKRKGTYDLICAIEQVIDINPNVKFYLGGDGDIEICKQICNGKNLTPYVEFLGWIKGMDKEKFLKNCSIFVLPTYHEGMPMSILEAMSYGCAVVSTPVGGIPGVIKNLENGLLHRTGDINELAKAIKMLCADIYLKKTLGKNAYDTVNKFFNIDKNIQQLISLYNNV